MSSGSAVVEESAPICTGTELLFCPVTKDTVSSCATFMRQASHTGVDSWRNFHSWLWRLQFRSCCFLSGCSLPSFGAFLHPITQAAWLSPSSLCTTYLELSLQTMQAADDAENSQADTCSRVRGMLSPAHLTLSRPLPSPTAYKTAGLLGLMSLWMTKHMGSSHKICHVSLPANLTFLSYCILFDNLNSLRVFY